MNTSTKQNYSSIKNDLNDVEQRDNTNPTKLRRKIYEGNWTIYFIIGLISSSLFFAPFSFNKPLIEAEERQPFGPCMLIHLFSSGIVSFACLWNIFHTPSHGKTYTIIHRYVGKIGLIASTIGVIFGYLTTWIERDVALGLSIALSGLGIMQLYWTFKSYQTIRSYIEKRKSSPTEEQKLEENEMIAKHRNAVIWLWMCCIGPAWFRIPSLLGNNGDIIMFLPMPFGLMFIFRAENAMTHGLFW